MSLAVKYANHPVADSAWRKAVLVSKQVVQAAAGCSLAEATLVYDTLPEAFMNQLTDDLHKLYCMAHDMQRAKEDAQ